jgi:16S rRNA (uracil1498-N3)-methyltransferase
MSNTRIYISPQEISDLIEIKNKETIHKLTNVLRLEKTEKINIFDGKGTEYTYSIEDLTKKHLLVKKEAIFKKSQPPERELILAFPLIREEKINFILQKATELGVSRFIPYISQRSLQIKSPQNKLQRWRKITIEASRQSGQLWLPALDNLLNFQDLLKFNCRIKLVASIKGEKIETFLEKENILIVIGPEGDFSSSEYYSLKENNFRFIKLAKNILRVETAAIFAVGLLNYFIEAK